MTALHKTKWFLPLFSVALGVLFCAALWVGGERSAGLESLAIMTGLAVVVLLGGRSDLIRGLRGDGRDEYWQRIDVHATALAGNVLIVAVLAMCAWGGRTAMMAARTSSSARLRASPTSPRSASSGGGAEQRLDRRVVGAARRPHLSPRALLRVLVVAETDQLRAVAEAVALHLVVAHLGDELVP